MFAAVYARKSTEQNGLADEAKSVTRQIEQGRAFAAAHGWTVADEHVYVDDGISGAEFAKRPGFLRLMNALKPRPVFQVLIMSEESRLGREQIETAYALKQLITSGVQVWFYLDNRQRTLDSPMEKAMLALQGMADEMEREKARQRTRDAMERKAKAGHCTGGRTFGYDNVRTDAGAVVRVINEGEAAVVYRIFQLCAQGFGMRGIAQRLNEEAAACPRPQRGRPAGWAPSSVREVLYRPIYRGELVWNKSRKRDTWGQVRQQDRPEAEWLRRPAPELRVVDEALWQAAHIRLAESRALYLRSTNGQVWGHPARGTESKYLLVGLAKCGVCGSGLSVRTRSHGKHRAFYYVCTGYHLRGRHVCSNHYELPMEDTNSAVLTAVGEQVLTPDILQEAIDRAAERLSTWQQDDEAERLRAEREHVEEELSRLVSALATGGSLPTIMAAIREREARRETINARLDGLTHVAAIPKVDRATLRANLQRRCDEWRTPLTRHVAQARQLLRKVLTERLTVTPDADGDRYSGISGEGNLTKILAGIIFPKGMASPTGHRDWGAQIFSGIAA